MFLQGETPDPSDICLGNGYHYREMCLGAHISWGNTYHCNTGLVSSPRSPPGEKVPLMRGWGLGKRLGCGHENTFAKPDGNLTRLSPLKRVCPQD